MRKTAFVLVLLSAGAARADTHDEAEQRLRANDDVGSLVLGSTATSVGVTMLVSGISLASQVNWNASDCSACFPTAMFIVGGTQLTIMGLVALFSYGGPHHGKGHARHVNRLAHEIENPSIEAARNARRGRINVGWSLIGSGLALFAQSATLVAIGHQVGFDDDVRLGIAGGGAYLGSWLLTLGALELGTKWDAELAVAPTRGGAVFSWTRRWW